MRREAINQILESHGGDILTVGPLDGYAMTSVHVEVRQDHP
jgi:hypothetical protein